MDLVNTTRTGLATLIHNHWKSGVLYKAFTSALIALWGLRHLRDLSGSEQWSGWVSRPPLVLSSARAARYARALSVT